MKKYFLPLLGLFVSACMDTVKPVGLENELSVYDPIQKSCMDIIKDETEGMQNVVQECLDFAQRLQVSNDALVLKKQYKNDPRYLRATHQYNNARKKLDLQYTHLNLIVESQLYKAMDANDLDLFRKLIDFPSHPMNINYYNYMYENASIFKTNEKYKKFQKKHSDDKYEMGEKLVSQGKLDEGLPLLVESARLGHRAAGRLCGDTYYDTSKEKALDCYMLAVKNGDATSTFEIAKIYEDRKEYDKSFLWYTKSAESGNATSQYKLYSLYKTGKGVSKDLKKSKKWLKASADTGYAKAQYTYGMLLLKQEDESEAIKYLSASSKQEYKQAYYPLGKLYFDRKSYKKAYKLLLQSEPSADSMYKLGYLKEHGKGTNKSYHKACGFYKKAHKLGLKHVADDIDRVSKVTKKIDRQRREAAQLEAIKKEEYKKRKREQKRLADLEDKRLKKKWASEKAQARESIIRECGYEPNSSNLASRGTKIHLQGTVTQWLGKDAFIVKANGEEYYIEDDNDEARVNQGDRVNLVANATGERKVIRGMRTSLFDIPDESSIAKAYALSFSGICRH